MERDGEVMSRMARSQKSKSAFVGFSLENRLELYRKGTALEDCWVHSFTILKDDVSNREWTFRNLRTHWSWTSLALP